MRSILSILTKLIHDQDGQDLSEYALLITLISIALIAAITLIGGKLVAFFQSAAGAF